MADVATPSAIAMSTINAGSEATPEKTSETPAARVGKPEKPDEATYKKTLSEAEKALDAAQEKFVSNWAKSTRSFLDLTCLLECSEGQDRSCSTQK